MGYLFRRAFSLASIFSLVAACAPLAPVKQVAPAVSEPVATTAALDRESYRLGPGDKIRIDVFGEPDLSMDALIEASGTVNYPLLGRLTAMGLTLKGLEVLIAKRLSEGYLVNPSVRVLMLQFRPFYVTGQVHRVGAYPYIEGLTVEKALALAGGMTQIASTRRIYILREGRAARREQASLQSSVYPGDTIVVDESLF